MGSQVAIEPGSPQVARESDGYAARCPKCGRELYVRGWFSQTREGEYASNYRLFCINQHVDVRWRDGVETYRKFPSPEDCQ